MKIFFLASIAASKNLRSSYIDIISILESEGHMVNSRQSLIKPREILRRSVKSSEKRAKELLKDMVKSDCVVFEGTQPTTGGGYYLSMALQRGIPVLFLIQEEYRGLYLASYNRLLRIKQYSSSEKDSLRKTIKNFLSFVEKKGLDKRFNLMISENMDNFLNDIARESGISKADYIRNLIYTKMEEEEK